MPDWSRLTHAYGTAEDVPSLLREMEPDPENPVWEALWSRLCHQGTVYSASFAALPELTRTAGQWSPAQRITPLLLAGAIVASTDRSCEDVDPHVSYAAEIGELHRLTEEALQDPGLAGEPGPYVAVLGTLLAFEGVEVWGEQLDGLNDEEYEVPCPHCEVENYIAFGQYGCFSTTDSMYVREESGAHKVPLRPSDPAALEGLGRRLYARALADGHPETATKLTYVFGSANCAACGVLFRVDEAVTRR